MSSQYKNGIVIRVSDFTTCIINVKRLVKHKKYTKVIRKSKKYKVHIPLSGILLKTIRISVYSGDRVRIRTIRPISKTKRWEIYMFL